MTGGPADGGGCWLASGATGGPPEAGRPAVSNPPGLTQLAYRAGDFAGSPTRWTFEDEG